MIEGLPELYRQVAISAVTEEMLEKRSKAILSITSKRKIPWLLDCVRMYLKRPIRNADFPTEFGKAFKDEDAMFYESDNELELRLLAGAIVNEYIGKKKNQGRMVLAMALASGSFGMEGDEIINSSNISNAIYLIEQEADELRTGYIIDAPKMPQLDDVQSDFLDFPSVSAHIKKITNSFREFFTKYEICDVALRHKVKVLSEESQIHWWLFRSHSAVLDKPFGSLRKDIAPLALAYDLYLITEMVPGPSNSSQFLRKAFSVVPDVEGTVYSIKDVVDALYRDLRDEIEKIDWELFGNLCPLVFGVHKAMESAGDSGWTKVFENLVGIKADISVSAVEMATQFYSEALLCYAKY